MLVHLELSIQRGIDPLETNMHFYKYKKNNNYSIKGFFFLKKKKFKLVAIYIKRYTYPPPTCTHRERNSYIPTLRLRLRLREMNVIGGPGSVSGLLLRIAQFIFAAASLSIMISAPRSYFSVIFVYANCLSFLILFVNILSSHAWFYSSNALFSSTEF